MKSAFEQALDYTFANEGGFSNDTNDHGGATRYGITRAEASRWRKKPVSVADMKVFPIDEAKAIYKAWYWDTMALDKVASASIAICMFDIGVVMGIGIPPKFAQSICNAHGGSLVVDGHLGPLSIAAMNALDPNVFVRDFSAKTEARFRGIVANNSSQHVFLKGWLNRAHRLLTLTSKVAA
jgi:lysozyme family protein